MYKHEEKIKEVKRSAKRVELAILEWRSQPENVNIIDEVAPEASHTVVIIDELLDDINEDKRELKKGNLNYSSL